MTKSAPLSEKEVVDNVNKAILPGGRLLLSKHFRMDRMGPRNFDMWDAKKVLGECRTCTPKWNDRAQRWNYDIAGKDVEGNDLTIRIAIDDDSKDVILVTGF